MKKNNYSLIKSIYRGSIFAAFFVLFLFNTSVLAQTANSVVLKPVESDKTETLQTMQKKFNAYCDSARIKDGFISVNGKSQKVPNWKAFKRMEYFLEQRSNPVTGALPETNSLLEYTKYVQSTSALQKKQSGYNENWFNLGTNYSTGGYAGLGRINCVAFHPTDTNTIWVGSPSGGIWKTTNGGGSWTILNNNQTVLGVSDIIIPSDYATSNTIYIATGDRDGGSMSSLGGGQKADNVSVGVLKSTDGGTTWNATGLSYLPTAGKLVYKLLIHPTNNQMLIAATSGGIYKTTDGGATWAQKNVNTVFDLEFKPGDPTVVYASTGTFSSVYLAKSTNTGDTWTFTSIVTGRRGELAVSPNNPAVIYLLATTSTGGGYAGVYKSTDSGTSFTQVADTSKHMGGYYTDGSGPNTGQGTYDLCIAASPTDANTLFIGGICTWKSTDGGYTWAANNNWTASTAYNFSGVAVVHADKHALVYQSPTTLFEGNDGGIYKTTNGGSTWTDLSNGLVISQIYRIGISKTDSSKILAGLQDNGCKKFNGAVNTWSDVKGGDGFEVIIDNNNATSYMYVTYVNGQIYRNSNGFNTSSITQISANIPGGQPTGAWVTPYIMDPTNSAILYAGYDQIWETTNRGNSWTSVSQHLSDTVKLRSLAIAPSNTSVLYTADLSKMWKTTDGGATNWSAITLPTTANSVTYIAVKNNDPNTVWITYGGYTSGSKVYQTTDGGSSWTNISAGLPNLPIMCITQYKRVTDRNVLFVGTDVGVYIKDGANDWVSFSNGLPNVVASELEIYYGSTVDRVVAGTFGRGLWETELAQALPVELTTFTAAQKEQSILLNWNTSTEVNNFGFEIQRICRSGLQTADTWQKVGFVNGRGSSNTSHDYSFSDNTVQVAGKYNYRLKQVDMDGSAHFSKEVELNFTPVKMYALHQNYPNPFNPVTSIVYQVASEGKVVLKIYNMLGKEMATLVDENKPAGQYQVTFNAQNIPSGVYFYTLRAGDFTKTKKLTLLK
jgi:photosystem II stability/assembly factor-like uncharacterized protein